MLLHAAYLQHRVNQTKISVPPQSHLVNEQSVYTYIPSSTVMYILLYLYRFDNQPSKPTMSEVVHPTAEYRNNVLYIPTPAPLQQNPQQLQLMYVYSIPPVATVWYPSQQQQPVTNAQYPAAVLPQPSLLATVFTARHSRANTRYITTICGSE